MGYDRYHGETVYALMGHKDLEQGTMTMCADGQHGPARSGAACLPSRALVRRFDGLQVA